MSRIESIIGMMESVITIAAILVAGFWTYLLFIRRRQRYPRAQISHSVHHKHLTSDGRILHITTGIKNLGEILLSIMSVEIRIQQVYPVHDRIKEQIDQGHDIVENGDTEVAWPLLDERKTERAKDQFEIEP